ncbi:caspase family protein, partial [Nannocystis pusilla]|uniref:caspase family protein n=1 Tax=Nannocystis pusilla TaxID=889268 RepID=UPI003BF4430A
MTWPPPATPRPRCSLRGRDEPMPHRTALIVGVGAYQRLASLSNAVRDAQTIAEVLREVSGFDQVELLVNPDQRRLAEQIEHHFKNKEPEDLVLLYFSGHGITDDHGRLYFAVPDTYLDSDGQLVRASAVSCQHVHEAMGVCRSRRQVIILDCCHSGAFAEGLLAKNAGKIDLRRQLGGEGRAVLTSSSSHQFSFEESKAGLSLYTEFLVEGIVTGQADLNHDGKISIDELHEFAKSKLLQARPSMTPQILPSREGYSIVISHARQVDPKSAYAAKVLEVGDLSGQLSPLAAQVLLTQRQQLQITDAEALAIENSVLAPARARAQGRETLRRAVFEARRKGSLRAERSMLNQLRLAFDLTELELQALEKEPLAQQRRKIYGPPRWPQRLATSALLAVALVGCALFAFRRWNSDPAVAPADGATPHVATA